jgi:lupus La protein
MSSSSSSSSEPQQPTTTTSSSSEPSDDTTQQLHSQILSQIEFYFGEPNLRRDKWLRQRIESDKEGWVPVADLMTFNKLKAITTDPVQVANALLKSEILELDPTGVKVRNRQVKNLPQMQDAITFTAHAQGFPKDLNIEQITSKIESVIGKKPVYVQMRRDNKRFIGEVFIEFTTPEDTQAFVQNSDKLGEGYKAQMMSDFIQRAKSDLRNTTTTTSNNNNSGTGGGEGTATTTSSTSMMIGEDDPTTNDSELPGIVVKIDGLQGKELTRESFHQVLEKVLFIDYSRGEETCYIRVKELPEAEKMVSIVKEKFNTEQVKILNEEERKVYVEQAIKQRTEQRENRKRQGGGGGGGGRGGRSSHNKRQKR